MISNQNICMRSNNLPLVSVIIPNYNHAQYLDKRIETVLNQTYQNFEVIILDDNSTDSSLDVLEKYRNHPKVAHIVINEQNSGSPFKQWDKGFNLANGELIWIAESDDYNELIFLETLVESIVKKDCVLAFSSYVMFDNNGGIYVPPMHGIQYFSEKKFVSKWMSQENVVKNASGVIFKKEALNYITKDYMNFKQCGDYMFWVMIAEQGRVAFVNKNLVYWRITATSVTGKNISSGIFAFEDKIVYDYINTRYHLPWHSQQIVLANRFLNYKNNQYDSNEIKNAIFKVWGIKNRNVKIDAFLLTLFNKVRIHLGILL